MFVIVPVPVVVMVVVVAHGLFMGVVAVDDVGRDKLV